MVGRIAGITFVDIVIESHDRHIFIQPGGGSGRRDDPVGAKGNIAIQACPVQLRTVTVDDKSRDTQVPSHSPGRFSCARLQARMAQNMHRCAHDLMQEAVARSRTRTLDRISSFVGEGSGEDFFSRGPSPLDFSTSVNRSHAIWSSSPPSPSAKPVRLQHASLSGQALDNPKGKIAMTINFQMGSMIALIAGIVILIFPKMNTT